MQSNKKESIEEAPKPPPPVIEKKEDPIDKVNRASQFSNYVKSLEKMENL